MEKKHVVMTKDGMRVGVKEVGREGYVDRTQRYVFPPPPFAFVSFFVWQSGDVCLCVCMGCGMWDMSDEGKKSGCDADGRV